MRESVQEPLGDTDMQGRKELPTGKAQNSRCYKDNSVIIKYTYNNKRDLEQKCPTKVVIPRNKNLCDSQLCL